MTSVRKSEELDTPTEIHFSYARVWQYDFIPNCNQHLKTINRWYINGLNYAQTLRAWLKNFDDHQNVIKTLKCNQNLGFWHGLF